MKRHPRIYINWQILSTLNSHVHRHLDYRPPLDWVGNSPFPLIEDKGEIIAALACPPDPPHVAWIRLFAASYHTDTNWAWKLLWQAAYSQLKMDAKVKWLAAIPLHSWFTTLLDQENFILSHHILMLS